MKFVPKGIIPPIITPFTEDGEVNYNKRRHQTGEDL